MIAMLEGLVVGFVILTVVFVAVRIYAHSVRREALEKQFDQGTEYGTREDFIENGMKAYAHSLRKRLIWLVYILPLVGIVVITFLINRN